MNALRIGFLWKSVRTAIATAMSAVSLRASSVAEDQSKDEPTRIGEQVRFRFILKPDEDATYKHLASDDERTGLHTDFWAKRDTTPETPENEFKLGFSEESFWKRVEEANGLVS
jgi:hypothetical protein